MYEKKLNGTLRFNPETEGDIIKIVEEQAGKKGLTNFICSAVRYIAANPDDFDRQNESQYGIDESRREFFLNQRASIEELGDQIVEDYRQTAERYEKIEEELEKLYILAESGRLFGIEKKAELLGLESLLVKRESERIRERIWSGIRPIMTDEEKERLKKALPKRAEDTMLYLIEYYNKELSEFQMAMKPIVVEAHGAPAQAAPVFPAETAGETDREPEGNTEEKEDKTDSKEMLELPSEEDYNTFSDMFGSSF